MKKCAAKRASEQDEWEFLFQKERRYAKELEEHIDCLENRIVQLTSTNKEMDNT